MPKLFIYFHNARRGDGTYRRFPLVRFLLILVFMLSVGLFGALFFGTRSGIFKTIQISKLKLESQIVENEELRSILRDLNYYNDSLSLLVAKLNESNSALNEISPELVVNDPVSSHISSLDVLSLALIQSYTDTMTLFLKSVAEKSSGKQNLWQQIPVVSPVSKNQTVMSRRYGMGKDPYTGVEKMHPGVNFTTVEDDVPIYATAEGVVKKAYKDSYWGNTLEISHGKGVTTVYSHLKSLSLPVNRRVSKGDKIGTIGSSGWSVGDEVHYEIHHNGKSINPELLFASEMSR